MVAVGTSVLLIQLAAASFSACRRPSVALGALVLLQLAVGILNVLFLTPIVVQVVHLLLADLIWILLILLAAELGSSEAPVRAE
jgi:heme A synthase